MAQFIMPPEGAGYSIDPYYAQKQRDLAMQGISQNLGSSLGTLLQAVEQQRQQNYNKRLIDSVLGGGDLNTALKTAQGGTPRTGLAGILDAFNPNMAPTGMPDMMKSVAEAKLKTLFKTPKEVLEEQKIQAEIENLGAKTKKLGEQKAEKPKKVSGPTQAVLKDIQKLNFKTIDEVNQYLYDNQAAIKTTGADYDYIVDQVKKSGWAVKKSGKPGTGFLGMGKEKVPYNVNPYSGKEEYGDTAPVVNDTPTRPEVRRVAGDPSLVYRGGVPYKKSSDGLWYPQIKNSVNLTTR